MLPPYSRLLYRSIPLRTLRTLPTRRAISTAPPAYKSRSWKSSATRWGLALGGIYYYNNSDIFAEEPPFTPSLAHPAHEDAPMPTLESLALQRTAASPLHSASSDVALNNKNSKNASMMTTEPAFEETEEEASQEGAFNEETGEINWECPCLGGMAHGPCGEEFRAAFSCFVYSKDEPKGMDCIDNFKGMQDCFRAHPEHYPDEIADPGSEDDMPEEQPIAGAVDSAVSGIAEDTPISSIPDLVPSTSSSIVAPGSSPSETSSPPPPANLNSPTPADAEIHPAQTTSEDEAVKTSRAQHAKEQVETNHGDTGSTREGGDDLVPKEWHDTRKLNEEN